MYYEPYEGKPIRSQLASSMPDDLPEEMGRFIATLHQSGIDFRSPHLNNTMMILESRLGLIDLADMMTQPRPLGDAKRERNLKRLTENKQDRTFFETPYLESLRSAYIRALRV